MLKRQRYIFSKVAIVLDLAITAVSFDKWMEMDLEYIDNWSLGLDFKILIKTISAILSRKGAW